MSKIDELIKQMCPEGVERVRLGDVCDILRGKRVTKTDIKPQGTYPVISGGVTPMGFMEEYNREANTITVSQYGTAGYVDFQLKKFWANDICYCLYPQKHLNNRYLLYVLKDKQNYLYEIRNTNATPYSLPLKTLSDVDIPLPPLAIQQEIVAILDKFTDHIAHVDKTIELLQKQFEYYREKLLTFEEGECEDKLMSDAIVFLRTGLNPRTHFSLNTADATGMYVTVRELTGRQIKCDSKTDRINLEASKRIQERSKLQTGDILFSGTGTIGRTAIVDEEPITWNIKEGVYAITPNYDVITTEYLLYSLQSEYIMSQVRHLSEGGAVKSIAMKDFKNLKIKLPSLEQQTNIVSTLDKFEVLINDLKKLRDLRQKQYEYYREKLLTFE